MFIFPTDGCYYDSLVYMLANYRLHSIYQDKGDTHGTIVICIFLVSVKSLVNTCTIQSG